jgi:hypothetical protein
MTRYATQNAPDEAAKGKSTAMRVLDAARVATAAAESDADRIAGELEKAERSLDELEGGRGKVAHANGDVVGLGRAIVEARETIATLTAGLSEARELTVAAAKRQAIAELESRAEMLSEGKTVELQTAYEALGAAMVTIADLGRSIEACHREIAHFNTSAHDLGRVDLEVSTDALRECAKVKLGGLDLRSTIPSVVRQGETDEAWRSRIIDALERRSTEAPGPRERQAAFAQRVPGADFARAAFVFRHQGENEAAHLDRQLPSIAQVLHLDRHADESEDLYRQRVWTGAAKKLGLERKGETDEAYRLRQLNAAAREQDRAAAIDPLRKAGELALPVIQKHALGLSPMERNRRFPRPVSQASLQGRQVEHPDDLVMIGQRSIRSIRALRG